jgi:hypothetical protein
LLTWGGGSGPSSHQFVPWSPFVRVFVLPCTWPRKQMHTHPTWQASSGPAPASPTTARMGAAEVGAALRRATVIEEAVRKRAAEVEEAARRQAAEEEVARKRAAEEEEEAAKRAAEERRVSLRVCGVALYLPPPTPSHSGRFSVCSAGSNCECVRFMRCLLCVLTCVFTLFAVPALLCWCWRRRHPCHCLAECAFTPWCRCPP